MAYVDQSPGSKPVVDWATDWDWLDDQWGENAPQIWSELRESGLGVAFTERYGRAWMPLTHEAVQQIAQDTVNFSSRRVSVSMPGSPIRQAPPITSDPPDHHGHRRLLLPPFNPRNSSALEEPMRAYCQELIAQLDGQDYADAAVSYAQNIPVRVIAEMIGVPESDADLFRNWIHRNFQEAPKDVAVKVALFEEMQAYWVKLLDERRADPKDDLATLFATSTIDGEPISVDLQVGYLNLMILAGIDTTWSAIGSGLFHFGSHKADRDSLKGVALEDPRWSQAAEEVLRFYSPVTMAREVIGDTEVGGCPIHKGDQMLLTFPAANRDPEQFERANEFVVDREVNRHAAFGLGIHRCLGSNVARLEVVVALQEWIRAFPDYELDSRSKTTWANGQVRGPRTIPVKLNR